MITINPNNIIRYGYRKAKAANVFLKLKFTPEDSIWELKQELGEQFPNAPDNHETYVLTNDMGEKLVLHFSDWTCSIGTNVLVKNW